jgi:hypothetical protein
MDINYKFIGWCHDKDHDKVWAAIIIGQSLEFQKYGWGQLKWVTVWGRRGKKLQHKIFEGSEFELDRIVDSKASKGYRSVSRNDLDLVYPEFQTDLEQTTVWALLSAV